MITCFISHTALSSIHTLTWYIREFIHCQLRNAYPEMVSQSMGLLQSQVRERRSLDASGRTWPACLPPCSKLGPLHRLPSTAALRLLPEHRCGDGSSLVSLPPVSLSSYCSRKSKAI